MCIHIYRAQNKRRQSIKLMMMMIVTIMMMMLLLFLLLLAFAHALWSRRRYSSAAQRHIAIYNVISHAFRVEWHSEDVACCLLLAACCGHFIILQPAPHATERAKVQPISVAFQKRRLLASGRQRWFFTLYKPRVLHMMMDMYSCCDYVTQKCVFFEATFSCNCNCIVNLNGNKELLSSTSQQSQRINKFIFIMTAHTYTLTQNKCTH